MYELTNLTMNCSYVNIYQGVPKQDYYGRGDREVGLIYKLLNFNSAMYASNASESFAQIAYWSSEEGFLDCEPDMGCAEPVYSSYKDIPITDGYPPYTHAEYPGVIKIGGLFSIFDESGNYDIDQAENMAAFLMV